MGQRDIQVTTDATMVVSRRTLRVAGVVYPTGNICYFGPGCIPMFTVPTTVISLLFMLGGFLVFFVAPLASFGSYLGQANEGIIFTGAMFIIAAIGSILWNQYGTKRFGLMISMASGERRFFPTADVRGIDAAVGSVSSILEAIESEAAAQITVQEANVTIRDNWVNGPLNTGTVYGDVRSANQGFPGNGQ